VVKSSGGVPPAHRRARGELTGSATTFRAATVRWTWVVAFLTVIGSPALTLGGPPCLPACDPSVAENDCCANDPVFAFACGDYLGRVAAAQARRDECVDAEPECKPTSPGRCTIILGCVEGCQRALKQRKIGFQKSAFGSLRDCRNRNLGPAGRRRAARICNRCRAGSVTTSTTTSSSTTTVVTTSTTTTTIAGDSTTTTTTTVAPATTTLAGPIVAPAIGADACAGIDAEPCFQKCLMRIDSLRDCYDRCDDACDGNRCARNICRQGCRNGSCLAIRARCSDESDLDADPAYLACCGNNCRSRDESECVVTTSTTSTTTTTTPTTVTTTSLTTTTTSPQP
jgi:hypothetical protein